jgi:phosphoglycerate dehydrogenase-like enzyme
VTDEQLVKAERFDQDTLDELTDRAERVPTMSNAELARHLKFAREIDCYYVCENREYVKATVLEAAKRLSALGEENPAAH